MVSHGRCRSAGTGKGDKIRSGIIAVVLAGIVLFVGITYSFLRERDRPVDRLVTVGEGPGEPSNVVHVDELAQSPGDFQGEFTLRGVVAGVTRSEGVFAVIDSREFESCGVLTCTANTIPVRFPGDVPDLKNVVLITGRVVRGGEGLMVEAERVQVVQ